MRALFALVLVACNPHDAEVSGNWTAWLPSNSSSVVQESLNLDKASRVDCYRTEDESGYIGSTDDAPSCDDVAALAFHTQYQTDGYYKFSEPIDAWRTEALVNTEGDFQLTVHNKLNSGEDFRFMFTIDPDFAPVSCSTDDQGNQVLEYIDGSSWLDAWSDDEDGYTIYYLNAGAYQIDPGNSDNVWYIDSDWLSGYGTAKFSEDDFSSRPTDYAWYDPTAVYGSKCNQEGSDRLFYWESWYTSCESASSATTEGIVADIAAELNEHAVEWSTEMTDVYGAPEFSTKVEDNSWRAYDGARQGIDGWIDVNTSWVRIKNGSKMEVGGSAEGDFQILFEGSEALSRVLVTGTFKTSNIREDKWGYEDLEAVKREENGTPFCGGATLP